MMVAISVLAILMMIALPSYMDKLVREQVVEALALADSSSPRSRRPGAPEPNCPPTTRRRPCRRPS